MEKQIDNTFVAFGRSTNVVPQAIPGIVLAVVLGVGAVYALISNALGYSLFFAVCAVAVGLYTWFVADRLRRHAGPQAEAMLDWRSAVPEIQRQSLNIEVIELSRILDVDADQISDLQSAYIVAEDLALRQIQQEEAVPLLRHVSVGSVPFDAVYVKDDVLVCCEVSFLIVPELRADRVAAIIRKIAAVEAETKRMNIGMDARLMVVLITQLTPEDEEHLRRTLGKGHFDDAPVDIDIRLLDFEKLQKIYITD